MTTYEALMKTADHIEQHPHLYSFSETSIPHLLSSRGCVLGRLGSILGISTYNADLIAPIVINMDSQVFFARMLELIPPFMNGLDNPRVVAPALRTFAQSYRTQVIPQEIREIFNPPVKEQPHATV